MDCDGTSGPVGLVEAIRRDIEDVTSRFSEVVVAYSGGTDSTVVLALVRRVLPQRRFTACTVDWGPYLPARIRERIDRSVQEFQIDHRYIPGQSVLEEVARAGPSCNRCTRVAKLGTLRQAFGPDALILGGSNRSDSWGHRGMKLHHNTFSPLFDLEKKQIYQLAQVLGLPARSSNEHPVREGCYLKHLLKPLAAPIHARVVVESNVRLFELIHQHHLSTDLANVTVIGPLGENIALINLHPLPARKIRDAFTEAIGQVPGVAQAHLIDRPVTLTVRANPGQLNNAESLYWLHRGRIQPQFAQPVRIHWLRSTNRRLRTFQVVDRGEN